MGIVIPRPAMRQKERLKIADRLKRYDELLAAYIASGMSKESASRKAYEEVKKNNRATKPVIAAYIKRIGDQDKADCIE